MPRPLRALAVCLLGAVMVPAVAAPASAHAQLVSATPAAGSTVAAAPAEVRLSFDGPPADYGLGVAVTGPSGARLDDGRVRVDGVEVVQPVRTGGAGRYTVEWRVVSADGHPVSGSYSFTVAATASAAAASASGQAGGGGTGVWWLLGLAALAVAGLVALLLLPGRPRGARQEARRG